MKRHKKIIGITGFYILSFIVAVFLFGYILNYSSTHPARGQGSTSLAKLSVKSSGMELNKMYGFAQEMSQEFLRTCITPVSDNQTIVLKVEEGNDMCGIQRSAVLGILCRRLWPPKHGLLSLWGDGH